MNIFEPTQNPRDRYVHFAGRIAKVVQASIAAMDTAMLQRYAELGEPDAAWALGLVFAAWSLHNDPQIAVLVPTFALQWLYRRLEEVPGLQALLRDIDKAKNVVQLVELGHRLELMIPAVVNGLGGPERKDRLQAVVRALMDAYPLSLYTAGSPSLSSVTPQHRKAWEWLREHGYSPEQIQAIAHRRVRFS